MAVVVVGVDAVGDDGDGDGDDSASSGREMMVIPGWQNAGWADGTGGGGGTA